MAVDLRRSSPTFGRWVGAVLSDENHHQLWIPPGFAHGFYVLSAQADVMLQVHRPLRCASTTARSAGTIRALAIAWPLAGAAPPLLSAKDAAAPGLQDIEAYP